MCYDGAMEIERKFLLKRIPDDLDRCPFLQMEQAYLCREPVVRVRRENESYVLTCKGRGKNPMIREEINLPLSKEAYESLRAKAEGAVIFKRRYLIPYGKHTIELDHFESPRAGLYLAEVEFETEEEALTFVPPEWFGKDVTDDPQYYNANM